MAMLHTLLFVLLLGQHLNHGQSRPIPEGITGHHESLIGKALHYIQTNPETVDELMSRDYALVEGDTILRTDRNAVEFSWPTTEIAYSINPNLEHRRDDILAAMTMVSEHTCLTFINRTAEESYLMFIDSDGCSSYVGFIGGPQPLFVGPPCSTGNVAHEILHALGFHHEHTRTDRDEHILILTHNIMEGMENNFMQREGETFGLPYDASSIMHYGSHFFSANNLPTILTKGDVKGMGQRKALTELDIERVRLLYNCGRSETSQTSSQPLDVCNTTSPP